MTRRNPAQRDPQAPAREKNHEDQGQASGMPPETRRARARPERPPAGRLRAGAARDPHAVPIRRAQNRLHRLALSGELRHDSAVQLEAEIDALCEAGIGTLVLELSQLRAIDATGARVITMRCALCRRRGMRIMVEGLTDAVRETLEHAGLLERLPLYEQGGSAAGSRLPLSEQGGSAAGSRLPLSEQGGSAAGSRLPLPEKGGSPAGSR